MFLALYKKEIKSLRGLMPVIFIINLILIRLYFRQENISEPISGHLFKSAFLYVNLLLSAIIGFMQSAGENINNTRQFLFFRPVTQNKILFSKIISGLSVLTIPLALSLVSFLYGLTNPEISAAPWRWGMLNYFFLLYIILCAVYFGGLLVGADNKSKWYGFRLAGFIVAVIISHEMLNNARNFLTASILFILFIFLILKRLSDVYNIKKYHTASSQFPQLIFNIFAVAGFLMYIISFQLIGYKISFFEIYIDYKNNTVIKNYRSFPHGHSIFLSENNEILSDYSYSKLLDYAIYYNLPLFWNDTKRRLVYQGYEFYYNIISEKDKLSRKIWYYIHHDKFFEIYSITKINPKITEKKFIGYFGANGFYTDKKKVKSFYIYDSDNSENVYFFENENDTTHKTSYFLTPEAAYLINPEKFEILKIRDYQQFNDKFNLYINKKIFIGDHCKVLPGYVCFSDKTSNKISMINILDETKDFEIQVPKISEDAEEMFVYTTSCDTVFIIFNETKEDNKKNFPIYKKEYGKDMELIKTINKQHKKYWQTEFYHILFNQTFVRIYSYITSKLNDPSVTLKNDLFHHRNGLFSSVYCISSYIAGILLFMIIYLIDMRKYKYAFSVNLMWFAAAMLVPYFFPFAYLGREKNKLDVCFGN